MVVKSRRKGARSWARGIFAFMWIALGGLSSLYLFTLFTDPSALGAYTAGLTRGVSLPSGTGPLNAAQVASRIIDALSRPFYAGNHEVFITASIGIALYPEDGLGPDALLGCADQAMYQAKRAGSNRYSFFDPSMNAVAASPVTA